MCYYDVMITWHNFLPAESKNEQYGYEQDTVPLSKVNFQSESLYRLVTSLFIHYLVFYINIFVMDCLPVQHPLNLSQPFSLFFFLAFYSSKLSMEKKSVLNLIDKLNISFLVLLTVCFCLFVLM